MAEQGQVGYEAHHQEPAPEQAAEREPERKSWSKRVQNWLRFKGKRSTEEKIPEESKMTYWANDNQDNPKETHVWFDDETQEFCGQELTEGNEEGAMAWRIPIQNVEAIDAGYCKMHQTDEMDRRCMMVHCDDRKLHLLAASQICRNQWMVELIMRKRRYLIEQEKAASSNEAVLVANAKAEEAPK